MLFLLQEAKLLKAMTKIVDEWVKAKPADKVCMLPLSLDLYTPQDIADLWGPGVCNC